AYRRARQSSLWVRHPSPGLIEVTGGTRTDFLHRMSTQDLLGQGEWTVRPTAFTTPLARIVDWVSVVRRPEDVLLLTSPGRAGRVHDWLAGYVFFQDDVQLRVVEDELPCSGVYGPEAEAEIARVLPTLPRLAPGQAGPIPGGIAWRVDRPGPGGFRMLGSRPDGIPFDDAEGPASAAAYQTLRIEAGIPEFGAEITEETNPLEAGLEASISFEKGCYIGQEIIARMQSRGKRARRLVGLRLAGEVISPAVVLHKGSEVGRLTTSAHSPDLGWIGLAVVRTAALADPAARFLVGDPAVSAGWAELPLALVPER
ncbi:MAG: YgfZ/GcvT domain-containing protein, partial [Anaerolineales bacterium]